jgi:hypothetical protein
MRRLTRGIPAARPIRGPQIHAHYSGGSISVDLREGLKPYAATLASTDMAPYLWVSVDICGHRPGVATTYAAEPQTPQIFTISVDLASCSNDLASTDRKKHCIRGQRPPGEDRALLVLNLRGNLRLNAGATGLEGCPRGVESAHSVCVTPPPVVVRGGL